MCLRVSCKEVPDFDPVSRVSRDRLRTRERRMMTKRWGRREKKGREDKIDPRMRRCRAVEWVKQSLLSCTFLQSFSSCFLFLEREENVTLIDPFVCRWSSSSWTVSLVSSLILFLLLHLPFYFVLYYESVTHSVNVSVFTLMSFGSSLYPFSFLSSSFLSSLSLCCTNCFPIYHSPAQRIHKPLSLSLLCFIFSFRRQDCIEGVNYCQRR